MADTDSMAGLSLKLMYTCKEAYCSDTVYVQLFKIQEFNSTGNNNLEN